MMETMYKNTVPNPIDEGRAFVRVRGESETEGSVDESVRRLASQGVMALVFPSEEMMLTWRQRLAALA